MDIALRPVPALSLLLLAGSLGLAGCSGGDSGTGAPAETTATTTTGPPAAAPGAAATRLPDGFPTDVPIIAGTLTSKSFDVPGTTGKMWTLNVTDITAPAFDQAQQLLTDAGFGTEKKAGPAPGCDQQSAFSKDRPGDDGGYVVTLCSHSMTGGLRLTYSVNVYPRSDWGTNLVTPPGIPAFPPAPKLPG